MPQHAHAPRAERMACPRAAPQGQGQRSRAAPSLVCSPLPPRAVPALEQAASEAYEATMAPFHTMIIRGVVRAGLLTLPSRENFLASIGETEASAAAPGAELVAAAGRLVSQIQGLLKDVQMPSSDVWLWPSS